MSLHLSGPALNYNEGKKKKSAVMASLEYNTAPVCGEEREEEAAYQHNITVIYSLKVGKTNAENSSSSLRKKKKEK